MGKKKNAEAKASKTKGPKIPKEIAGVKIPKTLRDGGKTALKLAQNLSDASSLLFDSKA